MNQSIPTMVVIFRECANYSARHGWTRGRLGEDGGPRCATGVIASVVGADISDALIVWDDPKTKIVFHLANIAAKFATNGIADYSLMKWNDETPSHTPEDVVELFHYVADRMESLIESSDGDDDDDSDEDGWIRCATIVATKAPVEELQAVG